jgi:hypothetical protein
MFQHRKADAITTTAIPSSFLPLGPFTDESVLNIKNDLIDNTFANLDFGSFSSKTRF